MLAFQANEIVDDDVPVTWRLPGTVGDTVSLDANVVADADDDCAELLPAGSYADTVYEYVVDGTNEPSVHDVVPAAVVPIRVPLR